MNKQKRKYDSPIQATVTGILGLFRKQERVGSLAANERLDGKRILITGASSGLGLATAKQLAARGGHIIMAVRSGIPEKGEEVKRASGNSNVQMLYVDLSNFESIRSLVQTIQREIGQIDILICNAAVVINKARKVKQGFDEMFTVNYLAKFVLINGLLSAKCFREAKDSIPRIIMVSSESHRNPEAFEWDDFGVFRAHGMSKTVERYGYYKLLLTTFALELSRRLNPDGQTRISVFSLCPGPVNSNIAREAPKWIKPFMKIVFKIFFNSPEKAAEPVVYLSTSRAIEGKPTDYLFLMTRKEVDPKAKDPENGSKLWSATEQLLRETP